MHDDPNTNDFNSNDFNSSETPPPQKAFSYLGSALALIGLLLFLSTFFSAAMNFGDFTDFHARTRSMGIRAVSGMFLMIAGGVVHGIANRNKLRGRGNDDPLGSDFSPGDLAGPIKVRCPNCKALNDEAARFCDQCGREL